MGKGLPVLVLVDVQERLMPVMAEKESVLKKAGILLGGAGVMGWDVVATEQYPRGLGATLPEIKSLLPEDQKYIAKTAFSCFGEAAFREELERKDRQTLVLLGVESHVCVYQTALDALSRDYEVIVAADAVSSRDPRNRDLALAQLRHAGAEVIPVESILFKFVGDAGSPFFKAVSALVK